MTSIRNSSTFILVREKMAELFGADLRSLAVFRIMLALLVLADLAMRATDLIAHYTDSGVLPRDQLLEEGVLDSWDFSLNLINGHPIFQALVFFVGALAAFGMLVGYRTRLVTVIAFLILLSIQNLNPLVLNLGDTLLRLLLFWSVFLPLGAYWSVDRALETSPARLSARFLSFATAGLFLQIAFMYWFTTILKSGDEWRVDGTALEYALNIDEISTPAGSLLAQFPELLKIMTFGTLALEVLGPLLLFCPFFTGPVRTFTVFVFMSLHYGIWMTMEIGLFPWISAFCMICFLPAWFWDSTKAHLKALVPETPGILRRLRRKTAYLVGGVSPPRQTRFSVVAGSGWPSQLLTNLVSRENRPGGATTGGVIPSATLQNGGGDSGSHNNRGKVSKAVRGGDEPRMVVLRSSFAANATAALALVFVFGWNMMTVTSFNMPDRLQPVGAAFGLGQYWSMFAPHPSKTDKWYVLPGDLKGGQEVDLMPVTRDDFGLYPVSWEKPRDLSQIYESNHWRKYMSALKLDEYADLRPHFGNYVCSEWNTRHTGSERLVSFEIVHLSEASLPQDQPTTTDRSVLREHSCS